MFLACLGNGLFAQRNALSKQIGALKAKGEDASAVMAQVAAIPDALKASADQLDLIQAELQALLLAKLAGTALRQTPMAREYDRVLGKLLQSIPGQAGAGGLVAGEIVVVAILHRVP